MTTAPTRTNQPSDAPRPNSSEVESLWGEEQFTAILEGMVADFAPRVFAMVQERGDRLDARIAAWGIAFDDRAEVIGADGGLTMHLRTPDNALPGFAAGGDVTPRLVWVKPYAATSRRDDDAERSPCDCHAEAATSEGPGNSSGIASMNTSFTRSPSQ